MTEGRESALPPDVLVLHAPACEGGGEPWREAFTAVGWRGRVLAPDLPGHGAQPAPVGGWYDGASAVLSAVRLLEGRSEEAAPMIVVGELSSGWAATVIALAGRASAVALVDGLGGPWLSPSRLVGRGRDLLREIADDPLAVAPAPPSGFDPRLRHGVPGHGSRSLAEQSASQLAVPVLLVESPASELSPDDVDDLLLRFSAPVTNVAVPSRSPDRVVPAIAEWAGGLWHFAATSP